MRTKAEVVAAIESKLDAADDPLHVRCRDGVCEIGQEWGGRRLLWAPVPSLSAYLLQRGYGRVPDDDGIPF